MSKRLSDIVHRDTKRIGYGCEGAAQAVEGDFRELMIGDKLGKQVGDVVRPKRVLRPHGQKQNLAPDTSAQLPDALQRLVMMPLSCLVPMATLSTSFCLIILTRVVVYEGLLNKPIQ
ncbi:hypothetical protein SDC9_64557 [bioreactor metagenome]|uniref:Uncharacterized protein n=1 Tax=bioreactor metagenome TaxID=1076179 RepID=A0A644XQV3_9ZZZZ